MEDSNFTGIKEGTTELITVYFDEENLAYNLKHYFPCHWNTTNNLRDANVFFYPRERGQIEIQYIWRNKSEKIVCKDKNLSKSISIINNLLSTTENYIPNKNKKLGKLIGNLSTAKSLSINFLDLAEKNLALEEYFSELSKLDFFKDFRTKHLFLHLKGLSVANHYIFKNSLSEESSIPLSSFTDLFNAVKKSKNRTFGQTNLKAADFNILGTCLAHELTFKDFNIVILLSNDNFLDQRDEDIEMFNEIIPFFKYTLEITLERIYFKSTKDLITKTLKLIYFKENGDGSHEKLLPYIIRNSSPTNNNFFDTIDVRHKDRMVLLGELLNTLKHELSNPFFGLQLSTDLLDLEEWNDPDSKDFVAEMSSAVRRCQNIIETFTNIYSNDEKIISVDLKQLTDEILTLTKSESRNVRKKICFLDNNKEVNDLIIKIDTNKTWLAQILFNLIINCVQAINLNLQSDGEIVVILGKFKDYVEIQIKDNGPGMTDNQREKALQPFYTTKKFGTGLGLSICASLTKRLNGEFSILDSDKGAHFLLRFPYENSHN